MRFSESHLAAACVEDVFAARCEHSVREAACKASGALSYNVAISRSGELTRVQVDRVLPPNVPAMFRPFIGDSIPVRQVEEWAPTADGGRLAKVTVTIPGQPATMIGTSRISPDGAGSIEVTDGEVKVAIPLFGRQIEPEIAKVVAAALRQEQQSGEEWLASRT
jgi:hypothetical protein